MAWRRFAVQVPPPALGSISTFAYSAKLSSRCQPPSRVGQYDHSASPRNVDAAILTLGCVRRGARWPNRAPPPVITMLSGSTRSMQAGSVSMPMVRASAPKYFRQFTPSTSITEEFPDVLEGGFIMNTFHRSTLISKDCAIPDRALTQWRRAGLLIRVVTQIHHIERDRDA